MAEGHVVLVGLMGAGKTTLGARLAARLGRPFVDADGALEERTGRCIADIFRADGEARFREVESAVLGELLAASQPTVIAAGGGVVVLPASRRRLLDLGGTVVWLRASPGFLASRTLDTTHRPLLAGDPRDVLARLHDERAPLYAEVADVTLDVDVDAEGGTALDRLVRAVVQHEAGGVPA